MSNEEKEESFSFGKRIAEERHRLGFSQQKLGALCGKTTRTQNKYEMGETRPDAAYLLFLDSLGADIYYIVTGQHSANALSEDEEAVLTRYRALDTRAKAGVLGMLQGLTPSEGSNQAVFHGNVGQTVQGNQTVSSPMTFNMGTKKPKK